MAGNIISGGYLLRIEGIQLYNNGLSYFT